MTQLILSIPEKEYSWLKAMANSDGATVGEMVVRCVAWAQEQGEDKPDPEAEERAKRAALIEQKKQELEALMNPMPFPTTLTKIAAPSVLDMDFSNEPRAEEIEIPADPDDIPEPIMSGGRPGSYTRARGVNPDLAHGSHQGDGAGNVVRANFKHLGFGVGKL